MKMQNIFSTKLAVYFVCSLSLLIGINSTENISDDDSSTLLRDREARLKDFLVVSGQLKECEGLIASTLLILGTGDSDKILKVSTFSYSLLGVVHNTFANKSWDYRREAYQLARDLDIEMLPDLFQHLPCIKQVYSNANRSIEGIDALLSTVCGIGNCLNLTYVNTNGDKINETTLQPQIGDKFVDSTASAPPKVQRIRRILNAIVTLLANADKDKEFIGGQTEWYGEQSELNRKLWNKLVNYIFTVRYAQEFSVNETDDSEEASLLEERRRRLESFKKDEIDSSFNEYLSQIDEALESPSKDPNPADINSTFPHLVLTPEVSKEFRTEMYELVKDLLIEWGKIVHKNSPLYFDDILGDRRVYTPFTPETPLDTRDDNFSSTIFSELKYIAKLYNFTYVDYNGNMVILPQYEVQGKYIYPFNSTESSTSRQLRHIINGFERLYFNIRKKQGTEVKNIIRSALDRVLNCSYQPIVELTDIELPKDEFNYYIQSAHQLVVNSSTLSPDFRNISGPLDAGKTSEAESVFEQSDKWPLFNEARKCFINESLEFRTDVYNYIEEFYIQKQAFDQLPWVCHPAPWSDRDRLLTTLDGDSCHNFLHLLQEEGKQNDFVYINDEGEQVSIENYPSGKFVSVISAIFPELASQNLCPLAMKYLLDKLIELINKTNL